MELYVTIHYYCGVDNSICKLYIYIDIGVRKTPETTYLCLDVSNTTHKKMSRQAWGEKDVAYFLDFALDQCIGS
mgnify:CR=1 FL=1